MSWTNGRGAKEARLKIYFAGAETIEKVVLLKDVGVEHMLYSAYRFLISKRRTTSQIKTLSALKLCRHTIMDSGLYTLMYGAKAGSSEKKDIYAWQDALIKLIADNDIHSTCVECDCQRTLGADVAWELRKNFKEAIPDRQIINVFHYEDGRHGLDKLIDYSDYLAIGVVELRKIKPKTYKTDVINLAKYIRKSKPGIKIHLLGCTETNLLKEAKHIVDSADSTSWMIGGQYGKFGRNHDSQINAKKRKEMDAQAKKVWKLCGYSREITKESAHSLGNTYLSAEMSLARYTEIVGKQCESA